MPYLEELLRIYICVVTALYLKVLNVFVNKPFGYIPATVMYMLAAVEGERELRPLQPHGPCTRFTQNIYSNRLNKK